MEQIVKRFDEININKIDTSKNKMNYTKFYILDNSINAHNFMQIDKIDISFKQLYCIFREPPNFHEHGKTGLINMSFFEWKLYFESIPYVIYSWGDQAYEWSIGSNNPNLYMVNKLKEHMFYDLSNKNILISQ